MVMPAPSTIPPSLDPIIVYMPAPGALRPGDIRARVSPREGALLDELPETLELITVLVNEVASLRAIITPSGPSRRTRAESRARVRDARLAHPQATWGDVAVLAGVSRRYALELWRDLRVADATP